MRPANSASPIQRLFARELAHSHQLDTLSHRPAALPSRDGPADAQDPAPATGSPGHPDDLAPPKPG